MVLGSWMRFREWRPALAVAPGVATLPHHERAIPNAVAAELADNAPPNLVVLGIDAKTACVGGPTEWRVLGAGKVTLYRCGGWRRFASGDAFNTS